MKSESGVNAIESVSRKAMQPDAASHATVLIVDDTETNIDILVESLQDKYDICVAIDGETALELCDNFLPDLILLDIMMPGIDGYEVCRRLKANPATADIPVIFLTAMDQVSNKTLGFQLGAVDYITKPFEILEVNARVKTHIELRDAQCKLKEHNELLEQRVEERTEELALTQDVTILCMATLAETRDHETGGHIQRTQNYVKVLAEKLAEQPLYRDELSPETINLIYKSAPLHDIGKVGVPDSILLKAGKLTPGEFEIMKKHTVYGRDAILAAESVLGSNSFLQYAREIAYSHQEKWDGTGYPEGLSGQRIPLSGRLMALADVYDALISRRVYKEPYSHEDAVQKIIAGKGSHFDPMVVDAFIALQDAFRRIALEFADDDVAAPAMASI